MLTIKLILLSKMEVQRERKKQKRKYKEGRNGILQSPNLQKSKNSFELVSVLTSKRNHYKRVSITTTKWQADKVTISPKVL